MHHIGDLFNRSGSEMNQYSGPLKSVTTSFGRVNRFCDVSLASI